MGSCYDIAITGKSQPGKETMAINMRIIKAIGVAVAVVVIIFCGIVLFKATHSSEVNPQTFSGQMTIQNLTQDNSQSWAKACRVTLRDEKKQELSINTRSDVCAKSKPGDKLKVDAGIIILDQKQGY